MESGRYSNVEAVPANKLEVRRSMARDNYKISKYGLLSEWES